MEKTNRANWDIYIGIAGPILTCAGILLGVWQFNAGERNKVRLQHELVKQQDEIEFRRKLWLEKLKTYQEVAQLAGKLSVYTDEASRFKDFSLQFKAAYWGSLIFVDDPNVESELKKFYLELKDFEVNQSNPGRLKMRATDLIKACRVSSERPGTMAQPLPQASPTP